MSAALPAHPQLLRLRRLTDSLGGAMLGALVYAAWAVFANWPAGAPVALRAGCTHWLVSTALTYIDAANMRWFYGLATRRWLGMTLAFCAGLVLTYGVLIGAHLIVGTPNIALTLAAGALPNLAYCGGYVLLLSRTTPSDEDGAFIARKDSGVRAGPDLHHDKGI